MAHAIELEQYGVAVIAVNGPTFDEGGNVWHKGLVAKAVMVCRTFGEVLCYMIEIQMVGGFSRAENKVSVADGTTGKSDGSIKLVVIRYPRYERFLLDCRQGVECRQNCLTPVPEQSSRWQGAKQASGIKY